MSKVCDTVAAFNLGFAVFIFFYNCGFDVFTENRRFAAKLESLKADKDLAEDEFAHTGLVSNWTLRSNFKERTHNTVSGRSIHSILSQARAGRNNAIR